MDFILWIIAVILVIAGIVTAIRGQLLFGIILIVGGLTFLPGLALGPIADHLMMTSGTLF